MKKKFVLLLCLALMVFTFAACGDTEEPGGNGDPIGGSEVKTGFAVITTTDGSYDAGEEDGRAQFDSLIVGVTVDEDGKIVNCAIDSAQTRVEFSVDGNIVTPLDTVFLTKNELGSDYNMGQQSSIGKEWNEQAAAFADYVTGKTVAEVKGIAINEEGVSTEADLTSSVTIHVDGFIDGIEKAVANAQELGASADDKLGLGAITTIDRSTDAGEEDGLIEAYSNYTVITVDGDGTITSSVIDASVTNVTFSTEGVITSDINAAHKTKNDLGAEYDMASQSSIGKEWNEQAAAFAEYVTGKTLAEVKGIDVNEDGGATDPDLISSVTVHITDFMTILEKAFNAAS